MHYHDGSNSQYKERPSEMKIQHMKELLAVYEHGNYSKAADALFISQPALSRHVSEIEKMMGVQLINRNSHVTEFTHAGIEVCNAFRKIINEYDELMIGISEYQQGIKGYLRIGMLQFMIRQDFEDVLERLADEYPNIEVKGYSYQPQEIFNALSNGSIDIGVLPHVDYRDGNTLQFHDFVTNQLEVMMSKQHPLADKERLTLNDLERYPVVQLEDDPYTSRAFNEALGENGITVTKSVVADNFDMIPLALKTSNAVAVKPVDFILGGYDDLIISRPICDARCVITRSFVYRKDNKNPAIPLFLNVAKKCFK